MITPSSFLGLRNYRTTGSILLFAFLPLWIWIVDTPTESLIQELGMMKNTGVKMQPITMKKNETTKKELGEDGDKVICISAFSDVHEIEKDVEKEILIKSIREEESTHLDIGLSNNEICAVESDHMSAICCIDSTQKTTQRRPTLRELLQLPEDCGSPSGVMPQSKIFMRSEHQEQKQLVKQKAVSKQYKWWRIFKIKGLSWSSLYKPGYIKPEDIESKKSQRKNKNGIFGKVTNSAERRKLLKASDHIG